MPESILHGQVQGCGCFAATTHANQNDVRVLQITIELPVVVSQAKIDGLDRLVFAGLLASLKRPMRWFDLSWEFLFQRVDKGAEHVQHAPAIRMITLQHFHVDQGLLNTMGRYPSMTAAWLILRTAWCALSTVSMNGRRTWRASVSNWAEYGIAEGLRGDAGAVGNKEDGAVRQRRSKVVSVN